MNRREFVAGGVGLLAAGLAARPGRAGAKATTIVVRAAARGGRFLGSDAADAKGDSAVLLVALRETGRLVAAKTLSGGAGSCRMMGPLTRNEPIPTEVMTPPQTMAGSVTLDIDRPTWLDLTVIGPLGHLSQLGVAQTQIVALPGLDVGAAPNPEGLVLEIPGLCVASASYAVGGGEISASAAVVMMCGCKIGEQIPCEGRMLDPWPPSDFLVEFVGVGGDGTRVAFPLPYSGEPSVFRGSAPWRGPALVSAEIRASQPKLGNSGFRSAWPAGASPRESVSPALLARFPALASLIG